jgi:DNA polymerase-4
MDDVGAERMITHVAIKVRFAPFFTTTRIHKLPAPTLDAAKVQDVAVSLLDRLEPGRPVRLLGVRVSLQTPEDGKVEGRPVLRTRR